MYPSRQYARTISIGGKIPLGRRFGSYKRVLIAYLALSTARTMLPFELKILKINVILPLLPFKCPICVYTPAVLLLTA